MPGACIRRPLTSMCRRRQRDRRSDRGVAVLERWNPQTGIGGDCFALLLLGGEGKGTINGSGWSPRGPPLTGSSA
jgi:hypothetical protein